MLIHGAIDDKGHPRDTMQLLCELRKARRPFLPMLYAKSRHGPTDPEVAKHLRATMLDFVLKHLKPAVARPASK